MIANLRYIVQRGVPFLERWWNFARAIT